MNSHLQRALLLLDQSRYEMASDELRQALAQNPEDPMAHAVLAICQAKRENHAEALHQAQTAVHFAPDDAYVYFAQSIVLEAQNHYPEAQAAIETAIGLNPYESDYFAQLSELQFRQRRWREALAAAEQGLELDAEDVTCTNLRAMALVKLGKSVEASDAIGTALKRAPEDALSHANMGWSLIEQGQHEKAMEHFRESLRLNPELDWARRGIIEAMKAKYFLYRVVLNWFLWMMKLSGRAQWGVLLGAYFGYQLLRRIAAANESLAPWITPLLVLYIAFAIMTWVSGPLFNLALRLSRFGRLALSREEIRTSNWVGLCVVGGLAFVIGYFVTGATGLLPCALSSVLLIPLLSHIYSCDEGWPRAAIILATAAMAELSFIVIAMQFASLFLSGLAFRAVSALGGIAFVAFVAGAIASQFAVNWLISVHPRHNDGRARTVWWVGGSLLALGTLVFVGLAALFALAVSYESPAGTSDRNTTTFVLPGSDDSRGALASAYSEWGSSGDARPYAW